MSGTSLGTLVTYNPWCVGPSALLEDIAHRFQQLNIHHVLVIDENRRAVGMVSEADLLRARQNQRLALVGGPPTSDTDEAPLIFARDVMTKDVVSISTSGNFRQALDLLLARHIHALAVVDQGRLVGIVTSNDFLREFSYGELPAGREPVASLISAKPPEAISPDCPLDDALLLMHESGISSLPVAQGDCPVGIVSQRDIVREKCRLDEQADYLSEMSLPATVARVVRNSPPIRTGQRLCDAATAMVQHELPAVTVVNQSNRLLGLITEDDLLRVLYDSEA
jgi:CBS domain-containing protein